MKYFALATFLLSALPAQAAEEIVGMPHPKLLMLLGVNLLLGGLLLFLMLVIASALWDRRKLRLRGELLAKRRQLRRHQRALGGGKPATGVKAAV